MKEISVEELKEKKDKNENFTLLDVRETHEYYISNIGGLLVPLDQLQKRLDDLDKHEEIIVMCRSGGRSAKACELLSENGFTNVSNLKGGINQWAKSIDSSLPVY